MKSLLKSTAFAIALSTASTIAMADGIISTIVNSPLSATGTVSGTRVGINVYLQKPDAMGMDFMDPNVIGYGIAKGGYIEVEMTSGYERDWSVGISQAAIMLVTGAPQQGLPGKMAGYKVSEGANENIFKITATGANGLDAATTMSPAPGAKGDPVRQRGIKVFHVGFKQSAYINKGDSGTITIRFKDADGKVVATGTQTVSFLKTSHVQIVPNNFPQKRRNHNWQTTATGGATPLPLTYMLYGKTDAAGDKALYDFKGGLEGVGVKDGLMIQDSNGDGKLDSTDTVVGKVTITAPAGATGQALHTLMKNGKAMLSKDTVKIAAKPGKRWGGSLMLLGFKAGSVAGKYRITTTLYNEAGKADSGDGASYTYTVIAK